MGMRVYVYRTAKLGDCTNGGVSGGHDVLCVVNVPGPAEPTDDEPAVMLDPRRGTAFGPILQPAERNEDGMWVTARPDGIGWMHGGNAAGSSDGRWREAAGAQFVAVHDRQETQRQYALLSSD